MNVAFGFLSVLLGYLCQSAPIRHRFAQYRSDQGLATLLHAIREFIAIRRFTQRPEADGMTDAAAPEANDPEQRLQELVAQLQAVA
jgi:hypothetical protein